MQPVEIRYATLDDLEAIRALYHAVTLQGTGIARRTEEVTDQYVRFAIKKVLNGSNILVAQEAVNGLLVAEIHTSRMEPMVFSHVLSDLTVVVHPAFQEHGIGGQLFETLLKEVELRHPQILRIELVARKAMNGLCAFTSGWVLCTRDVLKGASPAMEVDTKRISRWPGSTRHLRDSPGKGNN